MRKSILTTLIMLLFSGLNAESYPCNNFNAYPCDNFTGLPPCSILDNTFFYGEFLWWKAESERFGVGTSFIDTSTLSGGDQTINFRPYTFGYSPGFTLGLDSEFTLCQNKYAPYVSFTHFRSTQSQNILETVTAANTSIGLTPVSGTLSALNFSIDTVGESITYSGKADFLYNRLDLGVTKILFECTRFSIVPKVAFTYIHTRVTVSENMVLAGTASDSFTPETNVASTQNHFSGYGLTLGFDTYYNLACGLSFYSNLCFSEVWGPCRTSINQTDTTTATGLVNFTLDQSASTSIGRWFTDIQVGLQYEACICDWFQLAARLGWEFKYIPDQINFNQPFTFPASMKINGLVAGIGLGF